ncbi:MAG: asparagine synthase (glutamine-hydrolyzing) [Gammaproteobacteria bacterium]|nr:asparagine synthase (glutamine-hydrolyzing) [Gammaproteobacteria bacterium]
MAKEDLVIVFNGEIYNHRELRGQLQRHHGAVFRTESDTEVVLEAYRHLGPACLDRLVGMFAFAIHRPSDGTLFLARDHFGIKPLFFSARNQQFAFASEIKALLPALGGPPRINADALVASLSYLWVPGDDSCFADIRKLPPAHYALRDKDGALSLHRYWQVDQAAGARRREEEWIDALDAAMQASVARHLIADVEVGAFLSGGLDSSLLCALARRESPRLNTFTIGVAATDARVEQMPEDARYARAIAATMGFEHHETQLDANIVRDLPRAISWLEEPIGDPAAINTHLICAAARARGIKVLLSGMGADELFCGYRRQQATLLAMRYRNLPGVLRHPLEGLVGQLPVRVGGRGLRTVRWAKRFLEFAGLPLADAYRMSYSYYTAVELALLLRDDNTDAIAKIGASHRALFDSAFAGDPVNQMCFTDLNRFMVGLNLTYTDRASMAASTEVRVPFIDKAVVELAMSIPGEFKLRAGQGKYILKRVAERYLPRANVYRAKASFGAPIRSWISGALAEMVGDLLSRERVQRRGWFDAAGVAKLIDDDRRGRQDNAYRIYQLLTVELWFEQFIDRVAVNACHS